MLPNSSSGRVRRFLRGIRAAHARNTREWVRRMEGPPRGPNRPR